MLSLILLAASLLPVQKSTTNCADTGAHLATVETEPVRGPDGAVAVLKVSTADDHSKDSHDCNADYKLVFTPAAGATPIEVVITSSDSEYGRSLSLRLAGFSQDGKHVLGVLAEGGRYSTTLLFDYHPGDAQAQSLDLKMLFAGIANVNCIQSLSVIGTTKVGGIALESNSETPCGASRRWLVDPAGNKPQPLLRGEQFQSLYELKIANP